MQNLTKIFGGNARSHHSNLEGKSMLSNTYVTSHDIYASDIYYPVRYMAKHSYAERNIERALGKLNLTKSFKGKPRTRPTQFGTNKYT